VKILERDKVASRSMRDRFLREVEIAARIGHPNIVRILDAGERPDRAPYIVLEYLTGESVGDLLHREGRMSEDFALALAKRAAAALVAAHAEGVIHRDIKPDNLFLVDDGSVLKVLDFGMAKLQEGAFTAVGTAIGTVPYMAPEQSMADRVDGRADVYGLGITLFKMITGTLPFDTEDDATLVAHHLYTPMPSLRARLPGADPRIERVILAATRKLPDNRYPSMREMLEDVGRILGERDGEIAAPEPRIAPDVYVPENPISRSAARHLRTLIR
jgi:serine/threonine-protein kinase